MFRVSGKATTFASHSKANAKMPALFVYSGEKDNRSLLSSIVYRRVGENRLYAVIDPT